MWWDKLLKGKTAHIITTVDQPGMLYWLAFCKSSINQLKKTVLGFCGIKPAKVTYIQPIRNSKIEFRKKWLAKIGALDKRLH